MLKFNSLLFIVAVGFCMNINAESGLYNSVIVNSGSGSIVIDGKEVKTGDSSYGKGSGKQKSEKRNIGSFTRLEILLPADVNLSVGSAPSLKIRAESNVLKLIDARVQGDTLVLRSTKPFSTHFSIDIQITTPVLQSIDVRGAAGVRVSAVDSENLDLSVSGSGDVWAEGRVKRLQVRIDGSGDMDLSRLQSIDANVRVSGSGDVKVHTSGHLVANVTGTGDIEYFGNPARVEPHIVGVGDIYSGE